jgi:tetratricopeptide (TPR) repeat protein
LKAVQIAPKAASAQVAVGVALAAKDRQDEASACFRKAVELDPNYALGHHNLGASLFHSGHHVEAAQSYRRAVELEPNNAQYHLDLGLELQNVGEHGAALESFRRTVELDPTKFFAHYNLGCCQQEQQHWDEAIASYRKAIELEPNFAEAHCNLGMCLQNAGRLAEALPFLRRGHELGSKRADWSYPSAEWVRVGELRAAMEAKLPALLAHEIQPADNAERLEYVVMCGVKGLYHEAVRLSAEAFAADPRVADDLGARYRYNAACSAAAASAGRGHDAGELDLQERARLRQQALAWLRADLVLHARRVETGKPEDRAAVQDTLRAWLEDSELAGIRDAAALAALPAEERSACDQLWTEVAALLRRGTK